jgi:hypothetical protein
MHGSSDYATDILPGWLIIGASVGLALPTIIVAGTTGLAPHQPQPAAPSCR